MEHNPLLNITPSDQEWLLKNPEFLLMLMAKEDENYSHWSSVDPESAPSWPTARWTAAYERGRSIMAEDLEIWSDDLKQRFGFPLPRTRGVLQNELISLLEKGVSSEDQVVFGCGQGREGYDEHDLFALRENEGEWEVLFPSADRCTITKGLRAHAIHCIMSYVEEYRARFPLQNDAGFYVKARPETLAAKQKPQEKSMEEVLSPLMEQVNSGEIPGIYYGPPPDYKEGKFHQLSGKFLRGLKMDIKHTPGGTQWRICNLDYLGRESSGKYFPLHEKSQALQAALAAAEYYERPTPARKLLEQMRKGQGIESVKLSFYPWVPE